MADYSKEDSREKREVRFNPNTKSSASPPSPEKLDFSKFAIEIPTDSDFKRGTGTLTSEESKESKEISKIPGLGKNVKKLKTIASIFTPENRSPRPKNLRKHSFKSGTGALSNEQESIENLLRTSKTETNSKETDQNLLSKDKHGYLIKQLNSLAADIANDKA